MQKELGMKSNYQNVLKLFKEPYSVQSKGFSFSRQFFFFAFEFYISVAVTGGNSSLLHLQNRRAGENLPQWALAVLAQPHVDYRGCRHHNRSQRVPLGSAFWGSPGSITLPPVAPVLWARGQDMAAGTQVSSAWQGASV